MLTHVTSKSITIKFWWSRDR